LKIMSRPRRSTARIEEPRVVSLRRAELPFARSTSKRFP
jgi:hypothetical protein